MDQPRSGQRLKRLGLIAAAALLLGIACCSRAMERHGLFNNRIILAHARGEHEAAWRAAGLGETISSAELRALVARYEGRCPDLDQRATPPARVDCYFDLHAPWPRGFPETYSWTLHLAPRPDGRWRVVGVDRVARGMDL